MPADGPSADRPRARPGVSDDALPTAPGTDECLDGGQDVYWFVGGPLDGRVQTRPQAEPAPTVVRHQHLHEGPKIVHHYDLHEVAGRGGEYSLPPDGPAGPGTPDDTSPDDASPDDAAPDDAAPDDAA